MGYLDTGGSGALGKLSGVATVVVSSWAVSLVEPPEGTGVPFAAVALKLLVSSSGATNTDVQVQVSTDPTFATTVLDVTQTNWADGFHSVLAAGLTNLTTYYWRARAAETGTTSWLAWSPVWIFKVNTAVGAASEYVYSNFGIELAHEDVGAEYVYSNFGIETIHDESGIEYVYSNFGVEKIRGSDGVEYVFEGDVTTGTPIPRIWFVRPDNGRVGDGIKVFGFGFGDLPTDFNGQLQWKNGSSWVTLPHTAWQTYPPTSRAYTSLRMMDELAGVIDMQHTVIEAQIPEAALQPGFALRVVTEDV